MRDSVRDVGWKSSPFCIPFKAGLPAVVDEQGVIALLRSLRYATTDYGGQPSRLALLVARSVGVRILARIRFLGTSRKLAPSSGPEMQQLFQFSKEQTLLYVEHGLGCDLLVAVRDP